MKTWISKVALVVCLRVATASAAFVYESSTEFMTGADFNGDSLPDALVVDKLTGNARVGYQNTNGTLAWSAPLPTGVENPRACGIGRFLASDREALAITEPTLNRVHILDLSNPTNSPYVLNPEGVGPTMAVGLRSPYGNTSDFDWLPVWTSFNGSDPGITLVELFAFLGEGLTQRQDRVAQEAFLSSGNSLRLGADPVSYVAAMARGSNDQFLVLSPANHFVPVLTRSNLPPSTDYVCGTFDGELLPRFLFYVPGQSNLTIASTLYSNGTYQFGSEQVLNFNTALQRVYHVSSGTNGFAILQFGDGVRGLSLPSGSPVLSSYYASGLGAAGNRVTGVVPLTNGRFALMDAPLGSAASVHAQILSFNGSTYTQLNAGNLPTPASSSTRATVWLFRAEPFVNSSPGFVASVNTPDWSSRVLGLPAALQVRVETDAGPTSGLGNAVTNNLGAPPQGVSYGIPEQYRDDISLFSFAAPRSVEPVTVTISPAPGNYSAPLKVTLAALNPAHVVIFRTGSLSPWQQYAAPFTLSADTTVEYYATNSAGQKSTLQFASYTLGGNDPGSPPDPFFTSPDYTNPPPVIDTNIVFFSQNGTAFYGRRSYSPYLYQSLFGPTAYLHFTNSPFAVMTNSMAWFYLENFESGSLSVPGVTPSPGWMVAGPASSVDSVDAGGRSYYSSGTQTNLTLTFNAQALGGRLPTHAGVVWTDVGSVTAGFFGFGNVYLTARDANGVSLGTVSGTFLGNGSSSSSSAEDRFFGVSNPGGISSISISMPDSRDWEVDHIQFGYLASTGTIWAINLDGSGETFITEGARPRVSKNGRYMAFLREGYPFGNEGNLWVRDLATGQEARILQNTNRLVGFDWDLTGTNLLFDFNCSFWTSDLSGVVMPLPLTVLCGQEAPAVNPVDGRLAYHTRNVNSPGIHLTSPAVNSSSNLPLPEIIYPIWPSWSPDGSTLAMADSPGGPLVDGGKNLWLVWLNPEGSNEVHQVTAFGYYDMSNGFPHGAIFSPQADALVGAGAIFGTNGIWIIPLCVACGACEGSPIRLPTSPGDPIDFVGSIVAAPTLVSSVRPWLFITLQPEGAVVYWSAAYEGFVLESTADLTPPSTWTPITGPYTFDGYFYSHFEPVPAMAPAKFFRLRFPADF